MPSLRLRPPLVSHLQVLRDLLDNDSPFLNHGVEVVNMAQGGAGFMLPLFCTEKVSSTGSFCLVLPHVPSSLKRRAKPSTPQTLAPPIKHWLGPDK